MKHWDIIADQLHDAELGLQPLIVWIVGAHGYGKRFIVRADEKLTAFLKLEAATRKNSIDTLCRRWRVSRSR